MAKGVIWTATTLAEFIRLGNLTDFQTDILKDRCKNVTVIQMTQKYSCSESTIHREIAKIKKIYDLVQKEYPNKFPVRRVSEKEKYLDTH